MKSLDFCSLSSAFSCASLVKSTTVALRSSCIFISFSSSNVQSSTFIASTWVMALCSRKRDTGWRGACGEVCEGTAKDAKRTLHLGQWRTECRWRPGKEASLTPPCLDLRSFGSKFTVLKKVLATLLGLFGAPRSDLAPGALCPLVAPLIRAGP